MKSFFNIRWIERAFTWAAANIVFGQLAVQCNSQLADETTKQSHQEIKVQLTVVRFMKSKEHRERYLSK